jgi:hypothetical protein
MWLCFFPLCLPSPKCSDVGSRICSENIICLQHRNSEMDTLTLLDFLNQSHLVLGTITSGCLSRYERHVRCHGNGRCWGWGMPLDRWERLGGRASPAERTRRRPMIRLSFLNHGGRSRRARLDMVGARGGIYTWHLWVGGNPR